MYLLYEDDGSFKAGTLLSEADSSVQVESSSGKRSKIKRNAVLLRFQAPAPDMLLEQAQQQAETIDLDFLWECAPQEDFAIADLAAEYYGGQVTPTQFASLLFRVHSAPAYFHRRGKGLYRPAPAEILKAALAALERKRLQAEQVQAWTTAMVAGILPEPIARIADQLLTHPDKNSLEWKALDAACHATHSRPDRLLLSLGAWPHAQALLKKRLLAEHFPRGAGLPDIEVPKVGEDLPLAEVTAYSIDDHTTTEIDDAISVTPMADGRVRVGIHIAAPALAVQRDSTLDQIARARMSTVYMPGQKIPMQPESVIRAFSLDEGRPVPALSLYVLTEPATGAIIVTETRVERLVITRNLRLHELDHEVTEERLNDPDQALMLAEFFRPLWQLTLAWSAEREAIRGKPEPLGRVEYSFYIDGDADDPSQAQVQIVPRKRGAPVDRIVAECALMANRLWGQALADAGLPGIYRSQSGFGRVRMGTSALPHESIGVPCYAWCTSPLRRYVDLVNQSQLIALAQHGVSARLVAPYKPKDADLFAIIGQFEARYAAYADFQQAMERFWCLRWLQQQGLEETEAVVVREDLVRISHTPMIVRVPGLPLFERGQVLRFAILGYDEVDLRVELRLIEALAGLQDTDVTDEGAEEGASDEALGDNPADEGSAGNFDSSVGDGMDAAKTAENPS